MVTSQLRVLVPALALVWGPVLADYSPKG